MNKVAFGKVLTKKVRTFVITFLLVLFTTLSACIPPSAPPYSPGSSTQSSGIVQTPSGILQNSLLGDLSIGEVRKLLLDVLDRFNSSLRDAGTEIRTSGNSLEANAKDIIKEIDQKFGNRLDRTIKQLNAIEKAFFEDVGRTIQATENSIIAIQKNAGEEARQTIFEADILAYNSSYSLPCRNKIPRIVYATPNQVIVKNDDPFVKIRGNFLNIGSEAKVFVDEVETKVIARSSDEISLQIPDSILNDVSDVKLSSISLALYQTTVTPVICSAKNSLMENPLQISVKLTPQIVYQVEGFIEGSYASITPESTKENVQDFPQGFREIIDEDCTINETRRVEYSIPDGWEIIDKKYTELSSRGSSYLEGIDFTGNRAVVRIRLIGKYTSVRDPVLGIGKDFCDSRGSLKYDLTLVGRQQISTPEIVTRVALPRETFKITGSPGQTTFADIRHLSANAGLRDAEWYYTATVIGTVGRKIVPPVQINTNLPTEANLTSKMENGILSISIRSGH